MLTTLAHSERLAGMGKGKGKGKGNAGEGDEERVLWKGLSKTQKKKVDKYVVRVDTAIQQCNTLLEERTTADSALPARTYTDIQMWLARLSESQAQLALSKEDTWVGDVAKLMNGCETTIRDFDLFERNVNSLKSVAKEMGWGDV